jgi:tRNA dimethylallyltransferase
MKEKIAILIAGPTASGKSNLAIRLAKHFNSEIINADSMQVYKEISILTSKPTLKDTTNIKHHLYGISSVKKKFSTGQWLALVLKKIQTQWENKKIPIIVGGTGLYFKALTDGLVKIPEIPNKIRNETRNLHEKVGQKFFFKLLIKLDPLAKNFVLPTDKQRSLRVYEVKKFTNKSLFELIKKTKSNFETQTFKKIFINPPKEFLHKNIEDRVDKMLNSGAIKEVEKFIKMNVYHELSANKIIGIKEIKNYLNGKISKEEAKQLIIQKTRQYAKRQFTWSRGHMKSWDKIYSSNINDLYKKALNKIS